MIKPAKQSGFSLTEVLIAVGILATGMMFVAGVFPVAIHYTTVTTERTTAAMVAEEAFAKIRLYAQGDPEDTTDDFDPSRLTNPPLDSFMSDLSSFHKGDQSFAFLIEDSDEVFPASYKINKRVFAYPTNEVDTSEKQYFWSAVMRLAEPYSLSDNPNPKVQVTVFVCRKTRPGLKYYDPNDFYSNNLVNTVDYPMAVPIEVTVDPGDPEIKIYNALTMKSLILDGAKIVDDETGRVYRVMERYKGDYDHVLLLDKPWNKWWWDDSGQWCNDENTDVIRSGKTRTRIWVVPPAVNGSRNPCIAVYQRTMKLK